MHYIKALSFLMPFRVAFRTGGPLVFLVVALGQPTINSKREYAVVF
jgi:hypothetical protein